MSDKPIRFIWDGERLAPSSSFFARMCDDEFGAGEEVTMMRFEPRSDASHRHYFACINEAWQNLPDDMLEEYASPEHLRKKALIRCGYADERSIVCSSKAEALRVAAFVHGLDEYAIVVVRDATVRVFTPQSQAYRAMGKERFMASKDKVLDWVSQLIGTSVDDLQRGVHHA